MMSDKVNIVANSFSDMGLDNRLLRAIADMNWQNPTPIQKRAIPLALNGKDVLGKAQTGSGKTAGFAIPAIQKVLSAKNFDKETKTRVLALAPTKELAGQISLCMKDLTKYCSNEVRVLNVSLYADPAVQRSLLITNPDIIVGTPSTIMAHLKAKTMDLSLSLELLIVDESDLLFSFVHEKDMHFIMKKLPSLYQAMLMSATLSEDVITLRKIILHNPVVVKVSESVMPDNEQLTQYVIKCEDTQKFIYMIALFKLNVIQGKTLIFVANINRCFKLKLFLEQFGIEACVLNSELPLNSRAFIMDKFNRGKYQTIIAVDETSLKAEGQRKRKPGHKTAPGADKEYSAARGLDFTLVANVINFDFPLTLKSYTHRVGRTARGVNSGTVLSFVSVAENRLFEAVEAAMRGGANEGGASPIRPYPASPRDCESFEYRARDVLSSLSRDAIRRARLKEIRIELLNSQKLKTFFKDNPREQMLLRHHKPLRVIKEQKHLKHIPGYLVPEELHERAGIKPLECGVEGGSGSEGESDAEEEGRGKRKERRRQVKRRKGAANNFMSMLQSKRRKTTKTHAAEDGNE